MAPLDQLLCSALHGTAMRYAAERRNLAESIEELRQLADGHDDVIAEAAGISAGAWYAWPATRPGFELVAAGMLIMASGSLLEANLAGRCDHTANCGRRTGVVTLFVHYATRLQQESRRHPLEGSSMQRPVTTGAASSTKHGSRCPSFRRPI
jgi:hypothetical protein